MTYLQGEKTACDFVFSHRKGTFIDTILLVTTCMYIKTPSWPLTLPLTLKLVSLWYSLSSGSPKQNTSRRVDVPKGSGVHGGKLGDEAVLATAHVHLAQQWGGRGLPWTLGLRSPEPTFGGARRRVDTN